MNKLSVAALAFMVLLAPVARAAPTSSYHRPFGAASDMQVAQDMCALDLLGGSFDLTMCNYVWDHTTDAQYVAAQQLSITVASRILNGYGYVSDDIDACVGMYSASMAKPKIISALYPACRALTKTWTWAQIQGGVTDVATAMASIFMQVMLHQH